MYAIRSYYDGANLRGAAQIGLHLDQASLRSELHRIIENPAESTVQVIAVTAQPDIRRESPQAQLQTAPGAAGLKLRDQRLQKVLQSKLLIRQINGVGLQTRGF